MFSRKIHLRLFETDATGVLYFPEQLRLAQETLECCWEAAGQSLGELLREGRYLIPVVHAESDYFKPIRVGDEVEIRLAVEHIGTSSFAYSCAFVIEGDTVAGKTKVVHVVIDREKWQSCPIPEPLLQTLRSVSAPAPAPARVPG